MRAGELRHRVRIERLKRIPDGGGGWDEDWVTHAEVWAKVETLSGREYWQAQQVQSEATMRLTMRHRADLLPADRIVYDGQTLNIQHIADPDGRRERLEVLCKT